MGIPGQTQWWGLFGEDLSAVWLIRIIILGFAMIHNEDGKDASEILKEKKSGGEA